MPLPMGPQAGTVIYGVTFDPLYINLMGEICFFLDVIFKIINFSTLIFS